MNIVDVLTRSLHFAQCIVSLYTLRHSYGAITRLQQYESMSEKAAKWSNEAKKQLHKTRVTQASGAVSLIASVATSLMLVLWLNSSYWKLLLNIANASLAGSAQQHIANFWDPKLKVPLVEGFNVAIEETKLVKKFLKVLSVSWIITSVLSLKEMSMDGLLTA